MERNSAYDLICKALSEGRAAHGYLITGDLEEACVPLAEDVLKVLFTDADVHRHPDCHWLYPEKKSRIISVEAMHEMLIAPLEQTSYSGGWKTGIIVGADRLKTEAANAFLKTLEEPTPKTLFFLLTDAPERLLPTIISRCQRIDLAGCKRAGLREPYAGATVAALQPTPPDTALVRQGVADRLTEILAALKEKSETIVDAELAARAGGAGELKEGVYEALVSARYRAFRTDFLHTVENYFADEMRKTARGAGVLSRLETYYNVNAVEEMAQSFERNLNEATVLAFFADRIRYPSFAQKAAENAASTKTHAGERAQAKRKEAS